MSRADRQAAELARLEYAADRSRWNCRLVSPNGGVLVDVWAIERRTLVELLADAMFANAPGRGRGDYLRVELEPTTLDRIL